LRKIIILVIFLVGNIDIFAQPVALNIKKPRTLHVGANISTLTTTKAFFLSPSVVFEYGRSSVYLGPNLGIDYLHSTQSLGLHLHYQFYPNPKQKRIDFYFSFDMQWIKFKKEETFFDIKTNYIQNTMGYGFKLRIYHKLYFNQNFGLGFVYERKHYNYHNEPNLEGSRVNKFSVTGLLKFGIGYKF